MYQNLIKEAHEAGIKNIIVSAIVRHNDNILLLERNVKPGEMSGLYELPSTILKEGESIQQGLQRALIETTGLGLVDVMAYLGHHDTGGDREYYFVVDVDDAFSLTTPNHQGHSFVDIQEAVGYPITKQVRDTLDLFSKLVS
ncbi:MAG: hypothetical protein SP1CHLAM54_14820 [Chlamydiia bacterium]|nr:hypothetical protein [Chlamydiia bacterium]MCH9616372.1 hypothetical protein [Chlamydiia bacterium]MCH9629642.1 hypothetical protein [Chlamydiia bacterium]